MFEDIFPQDENLNELDENQLESLTADVIREIGVPTDLPPQGRLEAISEAIPDLPPELQIPAIEMVVKDTKEIKVDAGIAKILRNIIKTELGRGLEQSLKERIVDLAYEIDDIDLQNTLLVELEKAGILVRKVEPQVETKHVEKTKRKKETITEIVEKVEEKEFDFSTEISPEDWKLEGDAYLTGNGEVDEVGEGWLRLTDNVEKQHGYALYDEAINTEKGLSIEFDYTSWSKGYGGGSGMLFFLVDGDTQYEDFEPGAAHGNLGYAPKWNGQGMTNAVIGIALDENGNFSRENNTKPGGPGQVKDSISVRAGENAEVPFEYIAGTEKLSDAGGDHGIDISNQETRPDQDGEHYRHVSIQIKQDGTAAKLDVSIQMGVDNEMDKVLSEIELPDGLPETVKFGFSATTTGATSTHEINNVKVKEGVDQEIENTALNEISFAEKSASEKETTNLTNNVELPETRSGDVTGTDFLTDTERENSKKNSTEQTQEVTSESEIISNEKTNQENENEEIDQI